MSTFVSKRAQCMNLDHHYLIANFKTIVTSIHVCKLTVLNMIMCEKMWE